VVVVSDEAAQDPTQRMLMRLALPDAVGLQVLGLDAAAACLGGAARNPRRVMALAPGPQEILALLERGVAIKDVNVGGLNYMAGKLQLGRAVYLSAPDMKALLAIAKRGVQLEGRGIPSDPPVDIDELLLALPGEGA
jgi:mannose/fructose/N-acetylgalactosamine-specific phosphotransferase system component IIB